MYTIIDIETTGGNNKTGRITEIAAFLHNGEKLIDKFSTLINPGIPIPPFIKNLTGITDEMVASAPTFAEISTELNRFTANAIFVAHNAGFDYGFIKEEYRRIGKDFKRKTLCTVRLSRRSFPDLKSYSLGKITAELDIKLNGAHRAEADALATVKLFEKIIDRHSEIGLFDAYFGVPDLSHVDSPLINRAHLDSIADEYGVARFYDRDGNLIYAKRGAELLTSICAKLKFNASNNQNAFLKEVYRIEANITISPLLAQLVEVNDVLENNPKYNHGRFSMRISHGLFFRTNKSGTYAILDKIKAHDDPKMVFGSFFEGLEYLKKVAHQRNFELLGVNQNSDTKRKVPVEVHSDGRPLEWILPRNTMVVLDEASHVNERVALFVKDGIPRGYSIVDIGQSFTDFDDSTLTYRFGDYPELEMVLRKYIAKGRYEKIIRID